MGNGRGFRFVEVGVAGIDFRNVNLLKVLKSYLNQRKSVSK